MVLRESLLFFLKYNFEKIVIEVRLGETKTYKDLVVPVVLLLIYGFLLMQDCKSTHGNVVVPVVVQVEDPQEFRVHVHLQLFCALHALRDGLASVLLHLDVEELPARIKKKATFKYKYE